MVNLLIGPTLSDPNGNRSVAQIACTLLISEASVHCVFFSTNEWVELLSGSLTSVQHCSVCTIRLPIEEHRNFRVLTQQVQAVLS